MARTKLTDEERKKRRREYSRRYAAKKYAEDPEVQQKKLREWRAANPDKVREQGARQRAKQNPDQVKKAQQEYYEMNRDRLREEARRRSAKRRAADPEEQRRKKREWYRKTPEKQRKYKERQRAANSARVLERYHIDIDYKLRHLLRNRLRSAIKNDQKAGSAIRDLGCTIDELRAHLESLFTDSMTWDSWGHSGAVWHIDHIIPLASFDLTDRDQLLAACHYTNLQPLWAKENLQKGARC